MRWCSMHPRTLIFSPLDRRGEGWLNFLDFDFLNVFVSSFKCALTMFPKVHWSLRCSKQYHTSTLPVLCYQLHIDPFPIPHCQILNSMSWNCQLHIASATLSTCQIDFIFWVALIFFTLPPSFYNILPNA